MDSDGEKSGAAQTNAKKKIPTMLSGKSPDKVLLIQLKQLGDILMTTPSIRALHRSDPTTEIHYLTQSSASRVVANNPYLSKVVTVSAKPGIKETATLLFRLRRENYSVVIDFMGQPGTALACRLIGGRKRIGFKKRGRSPFYTHAVEPPLRVEYSAQKKLHLLSVLGITSDDTKLDFFPREKDRHTAKSILRRLGAKTGRPLVSVSPVSKRDYKVWPAEYFAEICDYLVARYQAQILFLWGPGEIRFVEKVKARMKKPSLPYYDVPTIAETAGLLESVDLHIGNDNGPMHFAIACGTSTVAIFGRPLSKNWTPPGSSRHLSVEFDPGCKRDCFYPKCGLECLTLLKPEMVIKMIDATPLIFLD